MQWTAIAAGSRHVCALASTTDVYCWGSNDAGQAGLYNERRSMLNAPSQIELPNVKVVSLQSGGIHTCAITDQTQLYCWGADAWTLSDPRHYAQELIARQPIPGARFSAVSAGQLHACAIETNGRVRCWGDTIMGAFGSR